MQTLNKPSDFARKLSEAGLPSSRTTITRYVKEGIINKPSIVINNNKGVIRYYTDEEIEVNIEKVRKYRKTFRINNE